MRERSTRDIFESRRSEQNKGDVESTRRSKRGRKEEENCGAARTKGTWLSANTHTMKANVGTSAGTHRPLRAGSNDAATTSWNEDEKYARRGCADGWTGENEWTGGDARREGCSTNGGRPESCRHNFGKLCDGCGGTLPTQGRRFSVRLKIKWRQRGSAEGAAASRTRDRENGPRADARIASRVTAAGRTRTSLSGACAPPQRNHTQCDTRVPKGITSERDGKTPRCPSRRRSRAHLCP